MIRQIQGFEVQARNVKIRLLFIHNDEDVLNDYLSEVAALKGGARLDHLPVIEKLASRRGIGCEVSFTNSKLSISKSLLKMEYWLQQKLFNKMGEEAYMKARGITSNNAD